MSPPELLTSILDRYQSLSLPNDRPFVTLTFAQSLDAKIAGQHGRQLILSGKESMIMTHWMRTMHDAILVGIGTALNDDPQLNVRHLPPLPEGARHNIPRPIVVDSQLRLSPTCKLLTNYQAGQGRQPWIICRASDDVQWRDRQEILQNAGAKVVLISTPVHEDRLSISAILHTLRTHGVRTLMVEGGARIIASIFEASISETSVIDSLIVTIAPTLVGKEGVGYEGVPLDSHKTHGLHYIKTDVVGKDTIITFASQSTESD